MAKELTISNTWSGKCKDNRVRNFVFSQTTPVKKNGKWIFAKDAIKEVADKSVFKQMKKGDKMVIE